MGKGLLQVVQYRQILHRLAAYKVPTSKPKGGGGAASHMSAVSVSLAFSEGGIVASLVGRRGGETQAVRV